jgi:hypothetical protein
MLILLLVTALLTSGNVSYGQTSGEKQNAGLAKTGFVITEQDVLDAQKAWGEGVVRIGKIYAEKGDYKTAASNHIDELYGYNLGKVLFKPTLASQVEFRTDKEGALSYFVAGNPKYAEDHGFAIKPWSMVRWESTGIIIKGNMAIAMGIYYFTPASGDGELKVEYSFAYTRDEQGILRIIMHDSHLPYHPGENH